MTAPEIHEDELEELLIYEDLFWEYFNDFLSLPAFPVRLTYNRLTGNVQELDDLLQEKPVGYGADDLQRERTLSWLRKERLPLFRKSPLFLKYKLAKLLLRPLEAPRSLSRYRIHGYSRQSNSAALSSLTSNPPTASHHPRGPHGPPEREPTPRMPSRARSSPAATGYSSEAYSLSLLEQYGDVIGHLWGALDTEVPSLGESGELQRDIPKTLPDLTREKKMIPDGEESRGGKPPAIPCSEDTETVGDLAWSTTDGVFTTTEDEEQFLKQHNLTWSSLQQLKEDALGTREGMGRFTEFLRGTSGSHLFHFWIDCEEFKEHTGDLEANPDPEESRLLSVRLFRFIHSKYQMSLGAENLEQIRVSQLNWGPTFHAFRRSQYDALRRLRSYWIPRFLIHQQRSQRRSHRSEAVAVESRGSFPPANKPRSGPDHSESERRKKSKAPSETPASGSDGHVGRSGVSREIRSDLLLRRIHSALWSDREAGGAFLHYLKRFESPQKARALLLWKDLGDLSGRQSQQTHDELLRQAAGYIDDVHLGPNAFRAAPEIPSAVCSFPARTVPDWGSACQVALAALFQPWIRFLRYDIAVFLEFCAPTLFQEDKEPAGETGSHSQPGQKRNKNEREHESFTFRGGKVHIKRKKERLIPPREVSGRAGDHRQDAETLKEMLHHRAVYKVYRNVVQDTEEPEMLKALELLRALMETQGDRRLLGLVKKTLELHVLLSPYTKGLRKRLEKELLKGQIRRSTLEETTGFLSSLLAESFGKFWAEMSGRLKDYGVERPGGEGWARIQPILKVIATKIVLKRLHGRKNQSCHPVKTLPSAEDIDLFNQALQVAAQGWPTPEVLHFLGHLQTHGPQEGLPLLENNLLCCLEVQKYKNIHHPMPDRGLVKRKVKVIKERFLLPQMNPVLQLSPELLQKALQEAGAAEQPELPPPTLFNHLQDALRDSLLPFWAGFRKTWVIRSPASAQRLPLLRVQQMLRRRLALFELEEIPTKTFHLPPLKNLPTRRFPSMVTFSFSISNGVKIMENSDRETPTPQDNRRMSQVGELPQISQMSLRTMQMAGT